MTTETTQKAPDTLWCGNPAHAEEGIPVLAVYLTSWPDGRFKQAYSCEDCLGEALRLYVLDDDFDGERHPVLIELAGAPVVTDELARLRRLRRYDDRKRLVLRMALSQMSVNTCTGAERGLIAGLLADLAPAAGAGDGSAAVTGSEEARP